MEIGTSLTARRTPLREAETLLHALSFFSAAGLAAFGWAVCRMLDWPAAPWVPLWFCAALLIYNADRLRPDPADALNIPRRAAASARWRSLSCAVFTGAAIFLVAAPLLARDWLTLGLVLSGALVCLNYSVPLLGFRWKDVPLLKTFFAPAVVTAAIFGLAWPRLGSATDSRAAALAALYAMSFLLFNMLLCDLRDLAGDRACGICSLPVVLGEKRTRGMLAALLVFIEALTLAAFAQAPALHQPVWRLLSICGPIYLGSLLLAVRQPRSERFYEWAVEGMLFLPALAIFARTALQD